MSGKPDPAVERLAKALSEGLDLCVRARRLDAQDRTNTMAALYPDVDLERAAPRLNASAPWAPYETRSATIPVWIQEQYEKDLAEWEAKCRRLLLESGLAIRARSALSKTSGPGHE